MEMNPELSQKAQYDLRLVEEARKGNQKAFAELMDRYRDSVYYMLIKMVGNSSDAEDLTIEAFGKAFRNINNYTPTFAFSTWLFRIATNNCIDFIRKKKSTISSIDHHNETQESVTATLQSDTPDPEEEMIIRQKSDQLKQVIKLLKPQYRTLIELRFFREFSYEEIANELGIPLGTVKAQIFRAKELLFNILRKRSNS